VSYCNLLKFNACLLVGYWLRRRQELVAACTLLQIAILCVQLAPSPCVTACRSLPAFLEDGGALFATPAVLGTFHMKLLYCSSTSHQQQCPTLIAKDGKYYLVSLTTCKALTVTTPTLNPTTPSLYSLACSSLHH
jgi:hypothetical protein